MLNLLDYGKSYPFTDIIGKVRHLAWPVNAYRVTLPKIFNDSNALNAFERVILELLNAVGELDADELAIETCIPPDLVKGILRRLHDRGFINEFNAIIMEKYNDSLKCDKDNLSFVTALFFRECITGKILPFLHQFDAENPLLKKEGNQKNFRTIRPSAIHEVNALTQRDVINALRTMKKRAAIFGREERVPSVRQITIVGAPEQYYIDCPIAIQKIDGEFRIADPFGNGFSLILEKAFEQLLGRDGDLAKWLLNWKKNLKNRDHVSQDTRSQELFETYDNRRYYPKLIANLIPPKNRQFRTLAKIHASIEWALFYACCVRPFKDVIITLRFTKQSEHAALLEQTARDLGCELPLQGFRPIREGKLLDFEDGRAYQETVLAVALLQAHKDAGHPLRQLISVYPDLIIRLRAINVRRNGKAHGKGGADAPQQELIDDTFMRTVVHALVPRIVFVDKPVAALNKDAQGDALLDARTSIQAEFGFRLFNRLGMNLQERLVDAECFVLSCHDEDDASAYIGDLYAATQASFEKVLADRIPPDISDERLIDTAADKAVKAKLCAVLSESLRTVRIDAVRRTLQGGSQSLGACVIALLLVADDNALAAIYDAQPTFLEGVTNLITLRGHGNEPLPLPKKKITHLRKVTLSIIQTLIEQ
ncbi:hypothetical protein [Acetobacter persici]|uniref:Uncharacterized protein n=1 Tax=Acetobacter persici TaxID=1076596 RepID=A0A6V8ICK2_9PROT|nr:hypothetical protein [Acetobacter persici]OUI91005.1 hypothetical protein HK19_08260 [Acetobacter persici]GFE94812.1 hypothetical protein DmAi_28710 [Acetobacter persici]